MIDVELRERAEAYTFYGKVPQAHTDVIRDLLAYIDKLESKPAGRVPKELRGYIKSCIEINESHGDVTAARRFSELLAIADAQAEEIDVRESDRPQLTRSKAFRKNNNQQPALASV